MRPKPVLAAGLVLVCLPLLAACGDTSGQDLCTQYDELVTAADELRAQDPVTVKADELRAEVEDFQAELDQFQAVSEGRLDSAISTLRAEVDALRQAAVDADTDSLEAARPMLEDTMDKVDEAWAVVQDIAETQCPSD